MTPEEFQQLLALARDRAGVVFPGRMEMLPSFAHDYDYACDAQPALVTVSNAGVPSYLTNYLDPKIIDVLLAPTNAVVVAGAEVKKGDWTDKTAQFMMAEVVGEIAAYGDYNAGGNSGTNINWPSRESYHYQTNTQWGEKELATAGRARIDWAARQNIASIEVLNRAANMFYFFGVDGVKNYGLLNDPDLPASILATADWLAAATSAETVYEDIRRLFVDVQTRLKGLVTVKSVMRLAMSPATEGALQKTNMYNVNVLDMLKKNFPAMEIVTAPEYTTAAGELVQLIVDNINGQKVVECAFTEKMRAHAMIVAESSFRQKKSQGTWGAVYYLPAAVGQMIGVA